MIDRTDEISFGNRGSELSPFVSDLEGLRVFDSNGNDPLDEGDLAFAKFSLWRDRNGDGRTDPGELLSVVDAGMIAMSLNGYRTGDPILAGQNATYATTDVVFATGKTVKAADALLAFKEKSHSGIWSEDPLGSVDVTRVADIHARLVDHFALA